MNIENNKCIYIFIGTEAELIKIFPIILLIKKRNMNYKIIATGQNDLLKSSVLKYVNNCKLDIILSDTKKIKKSALGLFIWLVKTYLYSIKILKKEKNIVGQILLIHGDTVSTVLGAKLGYKLKMIVTHIEAGLRSFDIFNPFPEELDRIITSKFARIHFAPSQVAYENLKKVKGKKFNTEYNTIVDSLRYSKNIISKNELINIINNENYFIFVMHRQENLAKKEFVILIINEIIKISNKIKCVIILHEITEIKLKEYNLLDEINNNINIIKTKRVDYFDFMKLLEKSEFVITDGGSNQEELYYMGKPCLILRNKTERDDGIGKNAIMYNKDINNINIFAQNYEKYKINEVEERISPSEIIVNELQNILIKE